MDDEFPETLDSEDKQAAQAKQLASKHLGVPATKVQGVRTQGCFSKTFDVFLQDGRNVIIQLRIEPLDTKPFTIAHGLLGDYSPVIEPIEAPHLTQQKVWPFYMTRIAGSTWLEQVDNWKNEQQVICMKSLGSLLVKTFVLGRSDMAVEKIIADLRKCRARDREDIAPYHGLIDRLIEDAPQLQALPLSHTHFNLNKMNILAKESGEVTGIVDWEMSTPQPFGINCGCIHYLAGEIVKRQWQMKAAFEEMERGFWKSLLQSTDPKTRQLIESNPTAVQTSVTIGTFFKTFSFEGEKLVVPETSLKALPTLLNYRIPAIRGSAGPYTGAGSSWARNK